MSTDQEIFDTVVTFLVKQGKRAVELGCMYRTEDGLKCAVGCLIPDELYKDEMEKPGVVSLLNSFPELDFLKPHVDLLVSLQSAHDNGDNWASIEAFKRRFSNTANSFQLNRSILDQLDYSNFVCGGG